MGITGRRKNGANRGWTSASSENFSSETGKSSNTGENDERGVHQLEQNRVFCPHFFCFRANITRGLRLIRTFVCERFCTCTCTEPDRATLVAKNFVREVSVNENVSCHFFFASRAFALVHISHRVLPCRVLDCLLLYYFE